MTWMIFFHLFLSLCFRQHLALRTQPDFGHVVLSDCMYRGLHAVGEACKLLEGGVADP